MLLHAFMPATADAILVRLGIAPLVEAIAWTEAAWGLLPAGSEVVVGPPLFPRIEE